MVESPTSDPDDIADRYATVTRKMVNDAAQVAIDAYAKIDAPGDATTHFTAADAIRSMTKLAGIAIAGGSELARISLQVRPDSGAMLVADQVATVIQRGLTEAAAVAGDVAEQIEAGTFRERWVDSAITLTGLTTLRAAEVAEAIAAGPGVLADPRMRFGPFEVETANTTDELIVTIDELARPDVEENIADLVCFEPTGGVLQAGMAREFWICIDSSGVASGIFCGHVKVFKKGAKRPLRTVPVSVAL